jgi:hypothetical protein
MCESLLLRMFVAAALVLAIAPANSETITVSSPVSFASNSGRCLDTLSRDIVIWLRNPTQNARLGDL